MIRALLMATAAVSTLCVPFFLFLSIVAFSDGSNACPGNQCSDGLGTGWFGLLLAIAGGVIAAFCALVLRRGAKVGVR